MKDATVSIQAPTTVSRRDFIKLGLGALGALTLLELGGAGWLYFRSRADAGSFGSIVTAGPVDNFPAGSVTEFPGSYFFLVRAPDGGFLAVYRRCPHLGCNVNWLPEDEHFYCPCHASKFDQFGDYESPPVPRALDIFPVQFLDGQVLVDTTRLQNRQHFTPDQLAYAA